MKGERFCGNYAAETALQAVSEVESCARREYFSLMLECWGNALKRD